MSEPHDHDGKGMHTHDPIADAGQPRVQQVEMVISAQASPDVELQPGSHFSLSAVPTYLDITEERAEGGGSWIVYHMHDVGGVSRRVFPPHIAKTHLAQLAKLLGMSVVEGSGLEVVRNLNGIDPRNIAG